jgi:hypothetical protein
VLHTDQYIVTDRDAHAWVEAWFPAYGWVKFEPTPATPASSRLPGVSPEAGAQKSHRLGLGQNAKGTGRASRAGAGRGGGGAGGLELPSAAVVLAIGLFALAAAWAGVTFVHLRALRRGPDGLLTELERAFGICGRPLRADTTLHTLERQVCVEPQAAAYIRSLCRARFADGSPAIDATGRRALRRELRYGLGLTGALRALIALPPLPPLRLRPPRVIH